MKTAFYVDDTKTRYTFFFPDDRDSDEITIVRTRPDNEQTAVVKVKSTDRHDYSVRGKRVYARGGAYGMFKMLRSFIRNEHYLMPISFAARFLPEVPPSCED